jgi:epoxyqueuosine reductase
MTQATRGPIPTLPSDASPWEIISQELQTAEFTAYGYTRLERPFSMDFYQTWLERDFAGEMTYLHTHSQDKAEPTRLLAQAQSAIVIAQNYYPHPAAVELPLKEARIALYAKGEDYHFWLKSKLNRIANKLREIFPEHQFVTFTDSGPVLERDLAYRAGLGWVGKNTCLIHPKRGSLFFISEIYTTLPLHEAQALIPDHCGTCTRCIDICPTQALIAPRELDARKCISYLTIEAKSVPPIELREKIGDWLFGCDLCQTVCPWNVKFQNTANLNSSTQGGRTKLIEDLRLLLTSSNSYLQKIFKSTAISRASGTALKRNAIVVSANRGLTELQTEIEHYLDHPKLGELAKWCLEKLTPL